MNETIVHQTYSTDMEDFLKNAGRIAASDDEPLIDDDVPHIVDEIWRRGPINAALKSAGDASIVLDLPLPPTDDVDDDNGGLWKSPRIVHGVSGALKKSSGTKFVELLATIRKDFDGHPEEYEAAVELVTRIRDEVRARAIAAAVS